MRSPGKWIGRFGWLVVGIVVGSAGWVIAQAEDPNNLMIGGPGPHYIKLGKLGIGKTNPAEALDVNGNVKISGKLTVGSDAIVNGRVGVRQSAVAVRDTATVAGGARVGASPAHLNPVNDPGISGVSTYLTADINATATTIPVASTTGFPPTGSLFLSNGADTIFEGVTYTGVTPTSFTGVTRGMLATAAVAHSSVGPDTRVMSYLMIVQSDDNTPRLAVTSEGKVGIGTATPSFADLEISNSLRSMLQMHTSSPTGPSFYMQAFNGGAGQDSASIRVTQGDFLDLSVSPSNGKLTINKQGDVIVGPALNGKAAVGPPGSWTGYFQVNKVISTAPPAADCDEASEVGRMAILLGATPKLYICTGPGRGWDYAPLSD